MKTWCKVALVIIGLLAVWAFLSDLGDNDDTETNGVVETETTVTTENTTEEIQDTVLLSAETEIYNDNDIIISVTDITDKKDETVINMTIVNNSDKDYDIAAHSYSINRLMAGNDLYGLNSVDVSAGKQAKLSIEIEDEWLSEMGIDEISTIEILFWAYYDDFMEWDSGVVTIQTDLYSETNVYNPTSEQVYDNDNMTVWIMGTDNSHIQCVIKNKTSLNADYTIDNCSVNEWTYDILDYSYDYYDEPINGGACAYVDIEIDDEFLDEYGIDNIDNFTFTVNLYEYDTNNYKVLLDDTSDKITIDFQ